VLTGRHEEGVQPQAWNEDAQATSVMDTGIVASGLAGTILVGLSFGISGLKSANMPSQALSRRMNLAVQSAESEEAALATTYFCVFPVGSAHRPRSRGFLVLDKSCIRRGKRTVGLRVHTAYRP